MMRRPLLALLFALILPEGSAAQLPAAGERVRARVYQNLSTTLTVVGRYDGVSGDSILVMPDGATEAMRIDPTLLKRLEQRGPRRRALAGLAYGFAAGAAAGVLYGLLQGGCVGQGSAACSSLELPLVTGAIMAPPTALLGALIGAASKSEGWRRMNLDELRRQLPSPVPPR